MPSYLGTSASFVGGASAIYAQSGRPADVTGSGDYKSACDYKAGDNPIYWPEGTPSRPTRAETQVAERQLRPVQ